MDYFEENKDRLILIKTVHTENSIVQVYGQRCTTQEEVDAINERVWRGLAKISVDHWRRTGKLL